VCPIPSLTSYTFALFPNPFLSEFTIYYRFTSSFSGQVIAKYVITDGLLNPVYKYVERLSFSAGNSNAIINMQPTIPVGRFRLFQTLSAGSYNNYSRSWINITNDN